MSAPRPAGYGAGMTLSAPSPDPVPAFRPFLPPGDRPFERRRRLLAARGWSPHAVVAARLAGVDAVLDVGCGDGAFLGALRGARVRVGVDVDGDALDTARRAVPGAAFHEADAARLPVGSARFGAVTFVHSLPHVPDPAGALREARRALRPGGRLLAAGNASGHLAEFWAALAEATRGHPRLGPLFAAGGANGPGPEARLAGLVRGGFPGATLDVVRATVALFPGDARELLDTYRADFPVGDDDWAAAHAALRATPFGRGARAVTVALALVEGGRDA